METKTIDIRKRPKATLRRDLFWTFASHGVVLVGGLALFILVAQKFGPSGFALYQLARGQVTILLPLILLGLPIAIQRTLTRSGDPSARLQLGFTLGVQLALTLVVLLLTVSFSGFMAKTFYGDSTQKKLLLLSLVLVSGQAVGQLCIAYFRGMNQISCANFLYTMQFALLPVAAIPLVDDVVNLVLLIGLLTLVFAGGAVLFIGPIVPRKLAPGFLEILSYGWRRAPGEMIAALFLATPAVIGANVLSLTQAGFVALGTTLVLVIASVFTPISMVMLPRVARELHGDSSRDFLSKPVIFLSAGSLVMAGVVSLTLIAILPWFLRTFLGSEFIEGVGVIRILILGAIPYSFYISLRGVVDAASDSALNSRHMALSYAVFLIGVLLLSRSFSYIYSIAAAFVFATTCLGILTAVALHGILRHNAALQNGPDA